MSNELAVIGMILAVVVLGAIACWLWRATMFGELMAEVVCHAVSWWFQ